MYLVFQKCIDVVSKDVITRLRIVQDLVHLNYTVPKFHSPQDFFDDITSLYLSVLACMVALRFLSILFSTSPAERKNQFLAGFHMVGQKRNAQV